MKEWTCKQSKSKQTDRQAGGGWEGGEIASSISLYRLPSEGVACVLVNSRFNQVDNQKIATTQSKCLNLISKFTL